METRESIRPYQVEKLLFKKQELESLEKLPEITIGDVGIFEKKIANPRSLLGWVRDMAQEHMVTPWDITQKLRQRRIDDNNPDKIYKLDRKYNETSVYVSDIHGGDEKIDLQLREFVKHPPEALILTGDIVGTETFNLLQRYFYNHLNNYSRNEILKERPDITNQELLEYKGKAKQPYEGFSLKRGFLDLRKYELQIAGKNLQEIEKELNEMSDIQIAQEIRRYADYHHYGHYASSLPNEVKQGLVTGLEKNAERLRKTLLEIQDKGAKVAIVEGNWDIRNPLDFEPNTEKPIPLSKDKRLFNTENFFKNAGIPYFSHIGNIETKHTYQLLLPFDQIVGYPNLPDIEKQQIQKSVEQARKSGKRIIFVAHGEPSFRAHNLNSDKQPTGEHAQVVLGFHTILSEIQPDKIVYSHMHDELMTKDNEIATNYEYQLNDGPKIQAGFTPFDNAEMIASFGYEKVSRKTRKGPMRPTFISKGLETSI